MIIALFILIGLMVYLIIGRTVINLLQDNTDADYDEWKGVAVCIFPLVLIWAGVMIGSDYLTDTVQEFFENLNSDKK
jgi:hypothetical protein